MRMRSSNLGDCGVLLGELGIKVSIRCILGLHKIYGSRVYAERRVDFTRFSRRKSTSSLELLERKRAHLVKMTVPADPIIKTFNVIKHL